MTATPFEAAGWIAVSLVTLLGDPLVIAGLGLAVYWIGDRLPAIGDRLDHRRRSLVFASIVGALALSAALKTGFAIERLPGAADLPGASGMPEAIVPVYTWVVGPGGYAFPSGHATAATVGWLGLAWAITDRDRRPLVLAGGLVAAIAASRVALGVHRPVEVVVGIAVGLTYLLVVFGILGRPWRAFALAGLIGGIGPIVVGLTGDSLLVTGVALGTAVGAAGGRRYDRGGWMPVGIATIAIALVAGVTFLRAGRGEALLATVGIAGGALVVGIQRWRQSVENR